MSREVRRVPVGWEHPVEFNPYWESQLAGRVRRMEPASRLHGQTERFVPLYGDSYTPAHEQWERERIEWEAGKHEHLEFLMRYHSSEGFENRDGSRDAPKPYQVYGEDGNTVVREFFPSAIEQLIAVYPYSDYATEPTPEMYMPDFSEPEAERGWCLYETVTEGTPVTPVFETAEELIDHLATVGMDYDQQPLRRASAEALVHSGSSWGSAAVIGGRFYDGAKDMDLLEALPKPVQS